MKNKLLIGGLLTSILFANAPVVDAMGNATVEFTGNNNVTIGETFTVYMNVTNINDTYDGVVSLGGNLSFDESKIEYISSKGVETPYLFQINEDYGYKIAGLDFTLDNGIRETLTVYEFTFKALEEGNTTITLANAKLTDSQSYIDTTVLAKEINIVEKEEIIIEEIKTVENKQETTEKETETVDKTIEVENKIEKETETVNEEVKEEEKIENNEEQLQQTQPEKVKETENFVEKIQKVFNELFEKLRNLFK